MAFKSKDGKRNFGNRQQAQSYDRSREATDEAPPKETDADGGEENEGQEHSDMDIHEHVAQHGPAEKVEISHAEGKHTKTSHHGGAKHVSHHDSDREAHEHGMMARGLEPQQQEEQPMQPMGAMSAPGAIPGM